MLRMLGRDEAYSMLAEQGSIRVDGEFCGYTYEFDRIDTEQLFASLHSTPATITRH